MKPIDWSDFVARAAIGIELDVERIQHAMRDRAGRILVQSELATLIICHDKLGQIIESLRQKEAA